MSVIYGHFVLTWASIEYLKLFFEKWSIFKFEMQRKSRTMEKNDASNFKIWMSSFIHNLRKSYECDQILILPAITNQKNQVYIICTKLS